MPRVSGAASSGLTGAAVWYDYVTTEADRLTFSFALAAAEHGAVLANHVEATALIIDGGRVVGVRAVDRLDAAGKGELMIRAQVTVIATGGLTDSLLGPIGASTGMPTLKAMNVVTRREAGDVALGGRAPSGRNLFLVPWRGRALFGTWESAQACDPGAATVSASELAEFMAEINAGLPVLGSDARGRHACASGYRAGRRRHGRARHPRGSRARPRSRGSRERHQGSARLDGLVSVAGREVHDRARRCRAGDGSAARQAEEAARPMPDGVHSPARRPDRRHGARRLARHGGITMPTCRAMRFRISSKPTARDTVQCWPSVRSSRN